MWDLFFELLSRIFRISKKKASSAKVDSDVQSAPKRSRNEKIGLKALQYYNSAEKQRKEREVKKAEKNYWESIKRWKRSKYEAAPAPFRELAKLYYHTGFTEKAIEVLDSYPCIDEELKSLEE